MTRSVRRWLGPSLLVAFALVLLISYAGPRIRDGAYDIRQAHHAMHDESIILGRVWAMVDRGDLHHKIGAYPGLYPYVVALVRLAVGTDAPPKRAIVATRWLSLGTMIAALLLTFVLFSLLVDNPWVGAVLVLAMSIHPEVILWSCRVHPDAFALLFTHASLAFLGFAAEREGRHDLTLATIFAGLSAGTKLHGVFVMPIIVLLIAWQRWGDRRALLLGWARHAAMFTGVFILCSPNLLKFPRGIINGFLSIQEDNVSSGGSRLDWFPVMVGASGLGWAGAIAVLLGLTVLVIRRRVDAVSVIAGFGLLYLIMLVPTIHMIQVRYAFPAMWPLLFVGLAAVVPRSLHERLRAGAMVVLIVLFLTIDRPAQRRVLDDLESFFERSLTPTMLAVGERLKSMQQTKPGRVISSPYVYVPSGIDWIYLWSFEDIPFPDNAAAIVLDHHFRTARPGTNVEALKSGARGFVATATIADVVIYQKR